MLFLDYQGEINVIKGLVAKSERKALKDLLDEKAKKNTKTTESNPIMASSND